MRELPNRLVVEALADSEAALIAHVAELERERDAYRLLCQQALHQLADETAARQRVERAYHRLLSERMPESRAA